MSNEKAVTRWQSFAILLVAASLVGVTILGIGCHAMLGNYMWLLIALTIPAWVGLWQFRREISQAELAFEQQQQQYKADFAIWEKEKTAFTALQQTIEQAWGEQAEKLHLQEAALAKKMVTYFQAQEFPSPIDLADATPVLPTEETSLAELVKKDRQLQALLQTETEAAFEKVRTNYYAPDGKFLFPLLRDDILTLIRKCAAVYRPNIQEPLLETNLEQVTRAVSHAALQTLVILEKLPLNLHTQNLNDLYNMVRQAVKVYGTYQAVKPYWTAANTAFYLGRLAMGANPVALGAWWFLSSLGQESAKALTTRVVHRQSITFLNDFVRVIGYEVATIYGGDFRHRDANWIYGTELTNLVVSFPTSRDSLKHALRELNALFLCSEYDRVYLLRCLTQNTKVNAGDYRADQWLSMQERRAIAERLEKFLATSIHGKSPVRVREWHVGVERRLGIKMSISLPHTLPRDMQLLDAARSLAGFLASVKQLEPNEILPLAKKTKTWEALSSDAQQIWQTEIEQQAFVMFVEPDLDPQSEVAEMYLQDLIGMSAQTAPCSGESRNLLAEVAAFLKHSEKKMLIQYDNLLIQQLKSRAQGVYLPTVSGNLAGALLDILGNEPIRFLYGSVIVHPPLAKPQSEMWLLGTSTRTLLFSLAENEPQLQWHGNANTQVVVEKNLVQSQAVLSGGVWEQHFPTATLRITTPLLVSPERFFAPLLATFPKKTNLQTN